MNIKTGKSTDQVRNRKNRFIGTLRVALRNANLNHDAKTALAIGREIMTLEGWLVTPDTPATTLSPSLRELLGS